MSNLTVISQMASICIKDNQQEIVNSVNKHKSLDSNRELYIDNKPSNSSLETFSFFNYIWLALPNFTITKQKL